MQILSTKILTKSQRDLLKGFDVVETSMIEISFGENFKIEEPIHNAIFTSANSVKSVFKIHKNSTDWFNTVYCVGNKTQYLLEKYGVKVDFVANNGVELANFLANQFSLKETSIKEVNWFCGNLRNNDLPSILAENGVLVTEYMVYNTDFVPTKVAANFDAILFYSPSGIKSYLKENKVTSKPVICIGNTTATEAVQHFDNVYMADETSVESVIEKAKEVLG